MSPLAETEEKAIKTWMINESNALENFIDLHQWNGETLKIMLIIISSRMSLTQWEELFAIVKDTHTKLARQLAAKPLGQRQE